MSLYKLLLFFLSISFYSCGYSQTTMQANSTAFKLSKKINSLIIYIDNSDSCRKAVSILDSATSIDSNCFSCYQNKVMFLYSLRQYTQAAVALDNCVRIKPYIIGNYISDGLMHIKLGDTADAKKYFQRSLLICNSVLDTIKTNSSYYPAVAIDKAIVEIILDKRDEANAVLKTFYNTEAGRLFKDDFIILFNKSRNDIIDSLVNPEKYRHVQTGPVLKVP